MSKQVLIIDPSNLLNSQPIQIIHKHPNFSHKIRSDLDPYEIVAFSYPVALANKIIPFLDPPTCTEAVTVTARTRSPRRQRQKTASPTRRTRRKRCTTNADTDSDSQINAKTSLLKSSPSRTSNGRNTTQNLTSLPTPHLTPTRSLTPPISFTPATTDTAYTSRTISPGGTIFSPLKPLPLTWQSTLSNTSESDTKNPSKIPPSALFTPAKPPPPPPLPSSTTTTTTTTLTTTKCNRPRNPPPLIHYDSTPTPLDRNSPLPTLCLRHNLPTSALRDVLQWCLVSVQFGSIVDLTAWMVRFRDTGRVRGIVEACRGLGLERMGRLAERLLERLEKGFGDGDEDEMEE